jgi:hypothetical protein
MKASKKATSWGTKRSARLAAGLCVLAISALGIGAASNGASAANGWGRPAPTTTVATTIARVPRPTVAPTPIIVATPSGGAVTNANGWG